MDAVLRKRRVSRSFAGTHGLRFGQTFLAKMRTHQLIVREMGRTAG